MVKDMDCWNSCSDNTAMDFDLKWIVRLNVSILKIHENISKILLSTEVIADRIMCNEKVWIKLEKKAK